MKIVLFFVLLLSAFFRFYNINSVPPSPSLDEVSIGYNAYSILKTGRDEYGTRFPLILRAYDDWRPALYVYLVIPFVKFLGLNSVSVRLPSIILSVLTVLATYFLISELFKKHDKRLYLALIGSFFLAISPWHIYLSRLGHEVNAGLAFFIFALLFLLKKRYTFSAVFFSLSFMSYQSEKVFIPLLLLGMLVIFKRDIKQIWKKLLVPVLLGITLVAPFFVATFSPNALIRLKGVSVYESEQGRFKQYALFLAKSHEKNDIVGKVIYNRRILEGQIYIGNYLSHFNPTWLFTNKSDEPHKVPNFGLLHLVELPFVLFGLITLAKGRVEKRATFFLLFWTFIAPLPATFANGAPHAMRSYIFLPTWQIFSALGFMSVFGWITNKKLRTAFKVIFIGSIIVSVVYLYKQYFFVFPSTQSRSFQYAFTQTVPYVLRVDKEYGSVVFSTINNLQQSYMFFLFYTYYDPSIYQKNGGTKSAGFLATHKIDKYEFKPIDPEELVVQTLYVVDESDFIHVKNVNKREDIDFKVLRTTQNLDGEDAIRIFEIVKKKQRGEKEI